MSNQLDKLFKDKLASHSQAPPAGAWTRVEAGLSKKNNGLIWLRIAAAVLLVSAVAATMTWLAYRNPFTTSAPIAQKELPVKSAEPEKLTPEKKVAFHLDVKKKSRKAPTAQPEIQEVFAEKIVATESVVEEESKKESPDQPLAVVDQPVLITLTLETVAATKTIQKPTVIEYRLETIESGPDANESVIVESSKEKSGFRKVIDFALEAKNSNPMGDLREAKDGLFARNFKKKQTEKR